MALLREGQSVGRWTVVGFLDEGGNGEVYEVAGPDGERAALKVLRTRKADSVPFKRFVREVDTVRALSERSGIMPLLDVWVPGRSDSRERPWYVMPLAVPLEQVLAGGPVHEVVMAVESVAQTLAALHAQGVVHRDIKPGNLLWLEGTPVVGDFGLVHLPDPDAEALTDTGRVPGSFGYIADEVMVDPATAEQPPVDVFALAKVLWKLLVDGALFPPQGSLRADGGPHSLARQLTVVHADALDRVLERATAPVAARISMAELAAELGGWRALPAPSGLPEDMDALLERARRSMDGPLARRDAAQVRDRAVHGMRQALTARTAALVGAVRGLDATGAQVGSLAAGRSRQLDEELEEFGSPAPGTPFHHGARVVRTDDRGSEDVLLVDLCLQVPEAGEGTVAGMLLVGDEETLDQSSWRTSTHRGAPGTDLEAAIDRAAAELEALLPEALDAFAARQQQA